MSGGCYSLKLTPNDRLLRSFFMAILFILRFVARNLLKESRRRNIFKFSFWCLPWDLNSVLTFNKPTRYVLYYGEFIFLSYHICCMLLPLVKRRENSKLRNDRHLIYLWCSLNSEMWKGLYIYIYIYIYNRNNCLEKSYVAALGRRFFGETCIGRDYIQKSTKRTTLSKLVGSNWGSHVIDWWGTAEQRSRGTGKDVLKLPEIR